MATDAKEIAGALAPQPEQGEKVTGVLDETALRRSVIDTPPPTEFPSTPTGLLYYVADYANEILPWGSQPKARDKQLRDFVPTENYFASAVGVVSSRNAAFSWHLEGPPKITQKMQDMLENANQGAGYEDLILKLSQDVYSQDNAGFMEIVREEDSPQAPVIGINHLDSARCYHTGSPKAPVIYQDRKGQFHLLRWYQVVTIAEMPTPVEGKYGLQLCALSRVLKACQIIKNIETYKYEKTGGRFNRAVHMIAGVTQKQVQDAIDGQRLQANAEGLLRYVQPLIVSSVDPNAKISKETLELASLPEGWSEEVAFKLYIAVLAMGFLEDYQTFAPLPGGNLGTSMQSEVLHRKSRGKGPALWMKQFGHAMNFMVLPKDVEYKYDEQDLEEERGRDENRKVRAEERKLRIDSREITPQEARQIAMDVGDLPQELFNAGGQEDVTADTVIRDDEKPDSQRAVVKIPGSAPIAPPPLGAGKEEGHSRPFRYDFEHYL